VVIVADERCLEDPAAFVATGLEELIAKAAGQRLYVFGPAVRAIFK
jgi:hypothetical protein